MVDATRSAEPLRTFLRTFSQLIDRTEDEAAILDDGAAALRALVAEDNWLPDEYTAPDPKFYRQYLLYCDPQERFSVVSFVWGPGQKTPVHDHTVWGLVGVLRGAEDDRHFDHDGAALVAHDPVRLEPGTVVKLSPRDGDIHQVSNAYDDRVSISIHVYGGNIGKVSRHVFDQESAMTKPFISGYCNGTLPNIWT